MWYTAFCTLLWEIINMVNQAQLDTPMQYFIYIPALYNRYSNKNNETKLKYLTAERKDMSTKGAQTLEYSHKVPHWIVLRDTSLCSHTFVLIRLMAGMYIPLALFSEELCGCMQYHNHMHPFYKKKSRPRWPHTKVLNQKNVTVSNFSPPPEPCQSTPQVHTI